MMLFVAMFVKQM